MQWRRVVASVKLRTSMHHEFTSTMSVCGARISSTPTTGHSTDCRRYAVTSATARYYELLTWLCVYSCRINAFVNETHSSYDVTFSWVTCLWTLLGSYWRSEAGHWRSWMAVPAWCRVAWRRQPVVTGPPAADWTTHASLCAADGSQCRWLGWDDLLRAPTAPARLQAVP